MSLPAEIEQGNTEYKVKFSNPNPDRFRHLVTQMNWRLNEGKGQAYYEIGVADDGRVIGLLKKELEVSLQTLQEMCQVLKADMNIVQLRDGQTDLYKAARVSVSRIADVHTKKQVRVAVIGDFDSGKSTLLGVLTRGSLDDGFGLARMQVFRHQHEIENGCTSSISEQILGVTKEGAICNFSTLESRHASSIENQSQKLIMFCDLAGHRRYLKITAAGLVGQFPDYAMLVIDANVGIQDMTKEHLQIVLGLKVSVFAVITKTDKATEERIQQTVDEIITLFKTIAKKQVVQITKTNDLNINIQFDPTIYVPIFKVSNVTGERMNILKTFLASVVPRREWLSLHDNKAEFHINGCFQNEKDETIVTGLVKSGTLQVHEYLLLGPNNVGEFFKVLVLSIEVQRTPLKRVYAGQTCAIMIQFLNESKMEACTMRKGMVLIHPSSSPIATRQFDAEVQLVNTSKGRILKKNIQGVIHAGPIQQLAKIVHVILLHCDEALKVKCRLRFEFMFSPEYLSPDLPLIFREQTTQAVGKVLHAVY